MLVLLTNDDGIDAPGIAAAEKAVLTLGWRYVVVAPDVEKSMCGHRVTTHSPLVVEERAEDRFAVQGTPADCVRLALFALELKPDLVLSGINAGGNMGQDIVISGTVAAAREAAYHGLRSIALSHYMRRELPVDWERTANWAATVLGELHHATKAPRSFWNVNFPHLPPDAACLPPRVRCEPARSPLNVSFSRREHPEFHLFDYTASYAERPRDPGSDVEACFGGKVAVSLLPV
ncbi:MAG: 5'/3'-nucleotidase SurE [Verrucomicrobiaceae bacterium]|jgi:5'-nucleotidase|nr:5'/3'-nucleotidase SurE [Verrucomicrobiaceae bacterium]